MEDPPDEERVKGSSGTSVHGEVSTSQDRPTAMEAGQTLGLLEANEVRKLRKTLREIEALELRRAKGEKMQGPQLRKIERRSEIQRALFDLQQ